MTARLNAPHRLPPPDGFAQAPVRPFGVHARRLQLRMAEVTCRRLQVARFGIQTRPRRVLQRVHSLRRNARSRAERLDVSPRAHRCAVGQHVAI